MLDLAEMRDFVRFPGLFLSSSGVIFPFGCRSLSWLSEFHPVRLLAFSCDRVDAFVALGDFSAWLGTGSFLVAEGERGTTEVWP